VGMDHTKFLVHNKKKILSFCANAMLSFYYQLSCIVQYLTSSSLNHTYEA